MTHDELLADVKFTLSPAGRERREEREIAFAEEIMRMRRWLERIDKLVDLLKGDPAP